jgi:hypothetical protein
MFDSFIIGLVLGLAIGATAAFVWVAFCNRYDKNDWDDFP